MDLFCFFYVAFNTVQVISRRVVGRAEETSTYSTSGSGGGGGGGVQGVLNNVKGFSPKYTIIS